MHINSVQLPYLCFVIRLFSVTSLHSASLKLSDWDSVTVVLVKCAIVSPPFPGSILGNGCKGTNLRYSRLVLERQNLLHYGRGIGYSKSESGDAIR